jgi:hypothetical protein
LVEGIVALMALLSLWVGISWLARLQDMALQATHASRYAAFAFSRNPQADIETDVRRHHFSGPTHLWADRAGNRLLSDGLGEVVLRFDRHAVLAEQAQAGGDAHDAQVLRRDWRIQDTGIVDSQITVAPLSKLPSRPAALSITGLGYFDSQLPVLRRHTAILADAGHASGDTQAQQRVADSGLAWADSANASYAQGNKIADAMISVDAAWDRAQPIFDWLGPWAGHVPDTHLDHSGATP